MDLRGHGRQEAIFPRRNLVKRDEPTERPKAHWAEGHQIGSVTIQVHATRGAGVKVRLSAFAWRRTS